MRVKTDNQDNTFFIKGSTDNIGIGTITPDVDRKLHVSGNVRIEGDLLVNGNYTQIDTNTATTEQWRITNDGTGPAAIIKQSGEQPIAQFIDSNQNSSITPQGTISNSNTSTTTLTLSNITDFDDIELETQLIFTIASTTYTTYVQTKTAPNVITIDQAIQVPNLTSFTYKLPFDALFIKNTGLIGIGTSTPRTELEIAGTQAIKIPSGTTAERPSGSNLAAGQIRYNTSLSAYEGYYSSSWNTLGGVADSDQDTFIQAESSAGADNDELKFFTANTQRAIIDSSGNLGIGTNTPSSTLDVQGNISLNEYIYHNGNTNTNLRLQSDQLTLSTHAQSKLDISTDITFDGGQTTDSNIGRIILKTADPNSNAIQLNAQHTTGGINLNSGSNGVSITSTGNSNFTSSSGTLTLSGASGLTLTASSSAIDIDSATLTIDTTSSVSIDAAAASNITTSSGALTISGADGINLSSTSSTIDIDSTTLTIDTTSSVSIDAAAASNLTTSSGTLTLSGASGLILAAPSSQIDIDSSTLTIDTTSTASIDAVGNSNFTTDSGNLTLSTTTSGSLQLSSAAAIQLQAATNQEITINNSQNATDFRIKTDNQDNTLFIKGSTDNVGIGTDTPDSDRKLHVSGNVRIEGDLLVNGNYTQIDTNTSTTEQWRITNDGTGPAVIIKQSGEQPIAQFIDSNQNSSITPQGTITNNNTSTTTLTLSSTTDFDNIELETQLIFVISATTYTTYVQSKTSPNQITIDQAIQVPNSTSFTYKLPFNALFIKNTGLIGIGTSTPRSELEIAGTQAVKIPSGTTAQRPTGANLIAGQIRYNTSISAYEGYYSSSWNTLGGVADSDQDTFIQAETSAGTDNDELKFFTANTQRAIIDSSGNVGIGTNTPSTTLDVQGNISLNEYLYHNGNTNTNLRLQSDQLTLSTHSQSKIDISTDITLDGGQSTDTNIGQIILKTADPNSNAIQLNAQHATSGITLNSGSNGISLSSTGNSNFTSSSGTLTLSGSSGLTLSATSSQIDIDSSTLTIDTTSSTSIDAVGDSNFTTDTGNLTLSTTTSGSLQLSSAAAIQLQAATSQEITINDSQNASDLRVKTDNQDNTLFIKGSTDNIGIGTITPDSDRKLHVAGNVRIEGDLLVNGNYTQIDTNTSTTEQWKVTNDGTGPAVVIKQNGDNPVAQFIDSDQNSSVTPQGTISNNNTSTTTLTLSSTTDFDNIELESQIIFTISSTTYTTYVQTKTVPNIIIIDQAIQVPNSTAFTYKLPFNALFIKNGGLIGIGTSTPRTELEIAGTQAIKIPTGTTAERPSGSNLVTGQIRYNTSISSFEGYYASSWSSLGGIMDTDQDTYIQAETSAGTDNDELKFFTANSQRAIIDSSGNVGIGTNTPSSTLDVQGNISLNEYINHNGNTNTNIRFQSDQLTLSTHAQSKLDISTNITLDGGQSTDTNIGQIILKTADPNSNAIQLNAQHATSGITLNSGSNGVSITSTGNSNFTSSSGSLTLSGASGLTLTATSSPIDIDSATLTIDTTSSVSIDAAAASNITTSSGSLTLSGADGLILAAPSSQIDIDSATLTIDTTSSVSIDAAAASNMTTSSGSLTLSGADGVILTAPSSQIDIDSTSLTIDTTSSVSIDAAAASNITTSSGSLTLSGTDGLILAAPSSQIDIDSATLTIDTTSTASIDAVGDSNFTTDSGNLTLSTTTSGSLQLSSAVAIQLQAAANQEVIINNSQSTSDFRVKTDNSNDTFFIKSSTDNIGIGTATPDNDRKLHVAGNMRVEGDLLVNGNYTQIDTNTSTTEQWRVTNDGTGPAVVVKQNGEQPIAQFIDSNQNASITPQGTIGNSNTSSTTLTLSSTTDYDNIEKESQLTFTISATTYTTYVDLKTPPNQLTLNQAIAIPDTTAFTYKLPHNALYIKNTGSIGIGTSTPRTELEIAGTKAAKMPAGTTAERPALSDSAIGQIRYNSTKNIYEGFHSSNEWNSLGHHGEISTPTTGSYKLGLSSTNIIPDAFQYLDNWIFDKLLDTPPAPTTNGSSVATQYIELNWTLPAQLQLSFMNEKIPKITSIKVDFKLSSEASYTEANTTTIDTGSNTTLQIRLHTYNSGSNVSSLTGTTYNYYTVNSNTSYDFRVYGTNDTSSQSLKYLEFTNLQTTSAGQPAAPQNLQTTASTGISIDISWEAPADNDTAAAGNQTIPPIEKYKISYTASSSSRFGGVITDSSTIETTDETTTTQSITPLNHGTTYSITVQAKNMLNTTGGPSSDGYSDPTSTLSVQTSFPTAPSFLQTTDLTTITNLETYRGTYPSTGVYKLDGTTQVAATGNIMNKNLITAGSDGGGGNLVFNQIADIRVNNTEGDTSVTVSSIKAYGGPTTTYTQVTNISTTTIGGFSQASSVGTHTNTTGNNNVGIIISSDQDFHTSSGTSEQGFYKSISYQVLANDFSNKYNASSTSYSFKTEQIVSGGATVTTTAIDFFLMI